MKDKRDHLLNMARAYMAICECSPAEAAYEARECVYDLFTAADVVWVMEELTKEG